MKRELHAVCQLCQPVLNISILYYIHSLCQLCQPVCLTCDSVLCTHCVKSGLSDSSQEMKKEMPFLSHCVVIGDDRKYLTMLVTLKCEVRVAGKGGEGRGGEGRGNVAVW